MSDQETGKKKPATNPDPFTLVAKIKSRGPAPVHLWDPPFCGDIDLIIKRDGTWVHEGKPIRRPAMVQLFASVLKLEEGKYYLVTPAEKVGIQVEDCPFIITAMEVEQSDRGALLCFTTNTGESVVAGAEHPLHFDTLPSGQPHPTLEVRGGMPGLLTRAVFYRLVELAQPAQSAGPQADMGLLGVWSDGCFFTLGEMPAEVEPD